jgi:tetratricopeptide (TPR) repeat protein
MTGKKARQRRAGTFDSVRWVWPLLLVVIAFALYSNAIDNPFVSDDKRLLAENPTVTSPSPAGFLGLWAHDYWVGIDDGGRTRRLSEDRNLYRPATTLSYWLNSAACGVEPAGFRWVNVLLHAGVAWLMGLWCASWMGDRAGWLASGLFLLHPVATDVVNRIAGRADLLAMLGVAAFLLVQSRSLRGGWTRTRLLFGAFATAVALGSKEVGVVVVPMALVQHALVRRRQGGESGRRWLGWIALGAPVAAYVAARLVVVGLPEYETQRGWELLQNPAAGMGWVERLPVALSLAGYYLRLCVVAWPLVAFDVPSVLPGWGDASTWLGAVFLVALVAALLRWAADAKVALLGAALWLCGFAVVSQLVVPIGAYSEVRLAYPLLAGFVLLLASGVMHLPLRRPIVLGVVLAMAIAVAALSVAAVRHRNAEFRNDVVLLEADLRHRSESVGSMLRLGTAYRSVGRLGESERLLAEVARRAPESSQAWFQVALLRVAQRDVAGARGAYFRVLALEPKHTGALMNLGVIEMNAGNLGPAERHFASAAALSPDALLLTYNMALLDARLGRTDEALAKLRAVLEAQPDLARVEQVLEFLERTGALPQPEEALAVMGN